jgi:hypothetical protein
VSEQKLTKAEQEQARIDAFLAKGTQPAPIPGDKPLAPPAVLHPQTEGEAQTAPEAPAAPADGAKPVPTRAKPPAARKSAAPAKKRDAKPWDDIADTDTAKFSMLYSTVLDAKMVHIGRTIPGGMSKQKMVKTALAEWVERTLAELDK